MPNKKNDEIKVKVDSASSESLEVDESATENFLSGLIETFQEQGALLEAQRIVEAKDKKSELDLILHDEEQSIACKATKNLK